jgi:hypothetical protein
MSKNFRNAWKVRYAYKNSPKFPRDCTHTSWSPEGDCSSVQPAIANHCLIAGHSYAPENDGWKMKARCSSSWRCILHWIGLLALTITPAVCACLMRSEAQCVKSVRWAFYFNGGCRSDESIGGGSGTRWLAEARPLRRTHLLWYFVAWTRRACWQGRVILGMYVPNASSALHS